MENHNQGHSLGRMPDQIAKNSEGQGCAQVGVCHGPRCAAYGGEALLAELKEKGMAAEAVGCQSLCPSSPVVRLNQRCLHRATLEDMLEATKSDPEGG